MKPNRSQHSSNRQREPKEFEEKVVQVSRVSKKTKGGNQMGFAALVVVGNRKGKVGVGLGKAKDVMNAVQKAVKKAKRRLLEIPMQGATLPFPVNMKVGAAKILLKPAPSGSGIIAGGPVRAVLEAAGVHDASSKIKGTNNKASNVYATMEALRFMRSIVDKKNIKLKSAEQQEQKVKQDLREQSRKSAEAEKKAEVAKQESTKAASAPEAKKAVVKKADKAVEKKPAMKAEAKVKKSEEKKTE